VTALEAHEAGLTRLTISHENCREKAGIRFRAKTELGRRYDNSRALYTQPSGRHTGRPQEVSRIDRKSEIIDLGSIERFRVTACHCSAQRYAWAPGIVVDVDFSRAAKFTLAKDFDGTVRSVLLGSAFAQRSCEFDPINRPPLPNPL
jgi:hypothetical protein